MDISKPLSQCSELRSEGKLIGMVGIKYEHLPNFCYWCRWVTHGEWDYKVRLWGKGRLRRKEQQYGEWLRADLICPSRKTIAIISGNSHNQLLWWRKNKLSRYIGDSSACQDDANNDSHSVMEVENTMDNFEAFKSVPTRVELDQIVG